MRALLAYPWNLVRYFCGHTSVHREKLDAILIRKPAAKLRGNIRPAGADAKRLLQRGETSIYSHQRI